MKRGGHEEGWPTILEEWPGDPMGWLCFPKGWPEGCGVAKGVELELGSVLELGQIDFPIPRGWGGGWPQFSKGWPTKVKGVAGVAKGVACRPPPPPLRSQLFST